MKRWATAGGLCVLALPANANIGLPLVAVFLPPLWVALVPIVLVETVVIAKSGPFPIPRLLTAVTLANIGSTLIGVPLLWFLLATLELICCGTALGLGTPMTKLYAVTVQAPWLIPYGSEFGWMVPSALLTMGILCAGMSVLVEGPIISRLLRVSSRQMWRPVVFANVSSYVALALCAWATAKAGVTLDPLYRVFAPVSEQLMQGAYGLASWFMKGSG